MPTCEFDFVTKEWLLAELRADNQRRLVILDCRSSNEYTESHIRNAVNFSIPSIMLRRLAAGKIELAATVRCRELKGKMFAQEGGENVFVLYNDLCSSNNQVAAMDTSNAGGNAGDINVLAVLFAKLHQDGARVVCLEGGFTKFRTAFPEWCTTTNPGGMGVDPSSVTGGDYDSLTGGSIIAPLIDPLPLMGLRSLRISSTGGARFARHSDSLSSSSTANSSTDSSDCDDRCDSSLGMDDMDRDFPVEILPFLYLGNAANSEDSQALQRHNIQYILNVTPDLPNVFEEMGHVKYMQIPITDHWSQNLAHYFPKAIDFIDEARENQVGVLVHCLAGISRSVTITLAYLMYKCSLNLNDAFNLVRARKSNIAPNFNFLEQLHTFEKELKLDVESRDPESLLSEIYNRKNYKSTSDLSSKSGRRRKMKCPNCGLPKDSDKITPTSGDGGNSDSIHCQCALHSEFLSPLASIGVSPDSGIEFDRWAAGCSSAGATTGGSSADGGSADK